MIVPAQYSCRSTSAGATSARGRACGTSRPTTKGNALTGDAVLIDTKNCLVRSKGSLVATIGVADLVIVDTPDALLVADKTRAQDVSTVVAKLKQSNRKEHEQPLAAATAAAVLRATGSSRIACGSRSARATSSRTRKR